MDGFDPTSLIVGASPWFLATGVLMALLRGDLVPRRSHEKQMGDRDASIVAITVDRDYYRDMSIQLLGITEVVADRATTAMLIRARNERAAGQGTPS